MPPDWLQKMILLIALGAMAIFMLSVGLCVIISRRPLLLSANWLLGLMLFMIAPPFVGTMLAGPMPGGKLAD